MQSLNTGQDSGVTSSTVASHEETADPPAAALAKQTTTATPFLKSVACSSPPTVAEAAHPQVAA